MYKHLSMYVYIYMIIGQNACAFFPRKITDSMSCPHLSIPVPTLAALVIS